MKKILLLLTLVFLVQSFAFAQLAEVVLTKAKVVQTSPITCYYYHNKSKKKITTNEVRDILKKNSFYPIELRYQNISVFGTTISILGDVKYCKIADWDRINGNVSDALAKQEDSKVNVTNEMTNVTKELIDKDMSYCINIQSKINYYNRYYDVLDVKQTYESNLSNQLVDQILREHNYKLIKFMNLKCKNWTTYRQMTDKITPMITQEIQNTRSPEIILFWKNNCNHWAGYNTANSQRSGELNSYCSLRASLDEKEDLNSIANKFINYANNYSNTSYYENVAKEFAKQIEYHKGYAFSQLDYLVDCIEIKGLNKKTADDIFFKHGLRENVEKQLKTQSSESAWNMAIEEISKYFENSVYKFHDIMYNYIANMGNDISEAAVMSLLKNNMQFVNKVPGYETRLSNLLCDKLTANTNNISVINNVNKLILEYEANLNKNVNFKKRIADILISKINNLDKKEAVDKIEDCISKYPAYLKGNLDLTNRLIDLACKKAESFTITEHLLKTIINHIGVISATQKIENLLYSQISECEGVVLVHNALDIATNDKNYISEQLDNKLLELCIREMAKTTWTNDARQGLILHKIGISSAKYTDRMIKEFNTIENGYLYIKKAVTRFDFEILGKYLYKFPNSKHYTELDNLRTKFVEENLREEEERRRREEEERRAAEQSSNSFENLEGKTIVMSFYDGVSHALWTQGFKVRISGRVSYSRYTKRVDKTEDLTLLLKNISVSISSSDGGSVDSDDYRKIYNKYKDKDSYTLIYYREYNRWSIVGSYSGGGYSDVTFYIQ